MKARVKATGEVVDVDFNKDALANDYPPYSTNEIPSRFFLAEQLEWIDIKGKAAPDYWTSLEHQYAGQFMQAMISSSDFNDVSEEAMADASLRIAHALVQKLKEEK